MSAYILILISAIRRVQMEILVNNLFRNLPYRGWSNAINVNETYRLSLMYVVLSFPVIPRVYADKYIEMKKQSKPFNLYRKSKGVSFLCVLLSVVRYSLG